jgi:hypothetical protein
LQIPQSKSPGRLMADRHARYRFVAHFHRDQITPLEFSRLSGYELVLCFLTN